MAVFIGRSHENKTLDKLIESENSEFLAIYGRRRVGKTYLIRNFANKHKEGRYFEFTGKKGASIEEQLTNFSNTLSKVFYNNAPLATPTNWNEALNRYLPDAIEQAQTKKKYILFFDELPWIHSPRSNFLSSLEYFWNTFVEKRSDILLVVCGSAASWMIEKIINSKAGLHNRLTATIRMLPFTLKETKEYLEKNRKMKINNSGVLTIYMAMGGIPYYLSRIDKEYSPIVNIQKAYSEEGYLKTEFNRLFDSLFLNSSLHKKIVTVLSKKIVGMTKKDILEAIGTEKESGGFERSLTSLSESGFIKSFPNWRNVTKNSLYRLVDEFTLFYLHLGKKLPKSFHNTPKYYSLAGKIFEVVCIKHHNEITKKMGISGIEYEFSSWKKSSQIDFLIDRSDNVVSFFEVKYSKYEYELNQREYDAIIKREQDFFQNTKCKKAPSWHFITSYGVKKGQLYNDLISSDYTMDIFFE